MLNAYPINAQDGFFVWGIARSGIHAISCWMYESYPNHKLLLDNQVYGYEPSASWEEGAFLSDYGVNHQHGRRLKYTGCWPQDWHGTNALSMLIFENHDLRCWEGFRWLCRTIVGGSKRTRNILVIRNLFQHYASFLSINPDYRRDALKVRQSKGEFDRVEGFHLGLWKMYAREFLESRHLPQDTIRVHFDRWVSDAEYRKSVAFEVGFETDGSVYEKVPDYGGGSSFDGLGFQNMGSHMKVRDRWAGLGVPAQDALLASIAIDDELRYLSVLF